MKPTCWNPVAPIALALSLMLFMAPGRSESADWPRWRGPDLNGISRETGWSPRALNAEPRILWRASLGTGFASFAVARGKVYSTGNTADTDTLFCFDAESGRELWRFSHPEPLDGQWFEGGTTATPTVDGDAVYILSRTGLLAALDAATGAVTWKKEIAREVGATKPTWGFSGSPYVQGDMLVVNVGKFGTALVKKTGTIVWTTGREESGYATPVPCEINKRKGLAIFGGKEFAVVDPLSGREEWNYPWKTEYDVNAADPIISGDKIFLSSGYSTGGALIDLSAGRPREAWANQNMHTMFNPAVLIGGFLYGISGQAGHSGDSGLACVEFATGKLRWLEKSLMFGAMTATTDKLIAISEKGELVIADVNPDKFVADSRGQVLGGRCWTTPVLADGRVYIRNAKGDMICVDLRR